MLSDRLKKARILAGLTQADVIEELAKANYTLSKAGLSKYERGGSTPPPVLLHKLLGVYRVKAAYLFDSTEFGVRWTGFRKRANLGQRNQERIRLVAERSAQLVSSLYRDLSFQPPRMKPHRWTVASVDDVEAAAQGMRDGLGAGDSQIDSLTSLIEDNNGIVIQHADETNRFDGLSGWTTDKYPVLVINKRRPADRKRLNLAHELGHLYMNIADRIPERTKEVFCHRFAAALLVPSEIALRELGSKRRKLDLNELRFLKSKYGLSIQAWVVRARDLGIISESHCTSLFKRISKLGWRKHEPGSFAGCEEPQRIKSLILRALSEGIITEERAEEILPGILEEVEIGQPSETPTGTSAKYLLSLPKEERTKLLRQIVDIVGNAYTEDEELNELRDFVDE